MPGSTSTGGLGYHPYPLVKQPEAPQVSPQMGQVLRLSGQPRELGEKQMARPSFEIARETKARARRRAQTHLRLIRGSTTIAGFLPLSVTTYAAMACGDA